LSPGGGSREVATLPFSHSGFPLCCEIELAIGRNGRAVNGAELRRGLDVVFQQAREIADPARPQQRHRIRLPRLTRPRA
jgi:hypothetical protein